MPGSSKVMRRLGRILAAPAENGVRLAVKAGVTCRRRRKSSA
jgi:hypothetical protein